MLVLSVYIYLVIAKETKYYLWDCDSALRVTAQGWQHKVLVCWGSYDVTSVWLVYSDNSALLKDPGV